MAALLTQGQTGGLGIADLTVTVHHSARVDVAALLLTASGAVRTDEDLVFYNHAAGSGVRLVPGQSSMTISLPGVPAGIDRIRVVVTLDDRNGRFGDHPPPHVTVADDRGNPLYEYVIDGLGGEHSVAAVDLVRGDDGWFARAVGRGHRGGFAALLTDHGVAVHNSPQRPVRAQEAAIAPVLRPGQAVPLRKQGADLSFVKMALGWDPITVRGRWGMRPVEIDLDAAALVFSGHALVDAAYFGRLVTRDGAVRHSGDNLTGEGKGDDEVIAVDLTRLASQVTAIVFTITSYAGHTFDSVRNAFWRLIDGTTGAELTRADLSAGGPHTGMVVAKLHREDDVWKIQALGHPIHAGHPVEAAQQITRYL
ncbi:TerD family protein [Nocardia sp. CC201C]|uniref:TerD family protein n=1 Tax=Nocardia sp. CC201C TaxID=3044575 RepID=UPI0024A828CE|nr:TerD family protein [Nocardia sp. CC201C]